MSAVSWAERGRCVSGLSSWAAQYITRLLVRLVPIGVFFSFLFFFLGLSNCLSATEGRPDLLQLAVALQIPHL